MKRATTRHDADSNRTERDARDSGSTRDDSSKPARPAARLHAQYGNQRVKRLFEDDEHEPSSPTPQRRDQSTAVADSLDRPDQRTMTLSSKTSDSDRTVHRSTDSRAESSVADLCPRCERRYRAGKPLDCDDCETALRRSTDKSESAGTVSLGNAESDVRISDPTDAHEQEAERVAEAIARRPRSDESREDTRQNAVRSTGGTATSTTEGPFEAVRTGGRSLPDSTREFFEGQFGADLSDVRVHTGSNADVAAQSIDAEAFTVGSDVVFASGNYRPETSSGRRLLAHELTHVVQNRPGQRAATATVRRQVATGGQPVAIGSGATGALGPDSLHGGSGSTGSPGQSDLSSPRFAGNETLESVLDDRKLLRRGDRGEAVRRVQRALVDAGHYLTDHGVDGIYGPETAAAVEAFQQANGLSQDGIVGDGTLQVLDSEYPEPNQRTAPGFESGGDWTEQCVLDVFCEWNEKAVEEFGSVVDLATFEKVRIETRRFENGMWRPDTRVERWNGYLSAGDEEIGIRKDLSCEEACGTLYQEWYHLHQPRDQPIYRSEVRAHRAEEQFRIDHGLPADSAQFRRTDPESNEQVVDVEGIESYVQDKYLEPGEEKSKDIRGRTLGGKVEVVENGKVETRRPREGDVYDIIKPKGRSPLNVSSWSC
jgi:peptidoglycan hydrolase-like protein with peptidoglycan-binding domain